MKRILVWLTCVVILFGIIPQTSIIAAEVIFGLTSGAGHSSVEPGRIQAMRFLNTAGTGNIISLTLQFNQGYGSGNVRMGVYADNGGVPGNLLLDAGEAAAGLGGVSINGLNLAVTQDTYYWLAFNLQQGNTVQYQNSQFVGSHVWGNAAYGVLPAGFPSISSSDSVIYAMCATVSVIQPVTITLGNLNQTYDGNPKSVTYATDPSGLAVSINYNGSSIPPTAAGIYTPAANINSSGYSGSASGTLVIAKATPLISWNKPLDVTYGTPLSMTQLNAAANIPGTFSYSPSAGTVLNAGVGQTLISTFTPSDTANYNKIDKSVIINVNKASQSITFDPLANSNYGAADFPLKASASSKLPVSFTSSNPSVAAVTDNTVHINGIGNCTITARQAGDANYKAAEDVSQSLTVDPATASIILGNLNQTYDGKAKAPTVTTNPPGLGVSVVYAQGGSAVAGPTDAGSYDVAASVTDSNYKGNAAGTLTIAKAGQTITFNPLSNKTLGDTDFTISATASSGLAVTFTASGACTISGNTIHLTGAGSASITAHQAGNNNFKPASDVSQSFTINAPVLNPPSGGVAPVGGSGGGLVPVSGSAGWAPLTITVGLNGLTSEESIITNTSGAVQKKVQLQTQDQMAILDISKGTVLRKSSDETLTILSAAKMDAAPSLPARTALLTAYQFGPEGAKFDPPLSLAVKYDPRALPSGADEDTLSLATWSGSKWVSLDTILDNTAGTAISNLSHFAIYALIVKIPPAPASLAISDLQITPLTANLDDQITIQMTIANTGGSPGDFTAVLDINGISVDSRSITVGAGQTGPIIFHIQKNIPGEYVVGVNGASGKFTVMEPPITTTEPAARSSPQTTTMPSQPPAKTQSASSSITAKEKTTPFPNLGALVVLGVLVVILIVSVVMETNISKRR